MATAAEDPGIGATNWIDTGGRFKGQMTLRWVLTLMPPIPECRVLSLAELKPPEPMTSL